MTPSALTGQLQQRLADFLRFSFWSSTSGMEQVVDDLLEEAGGLINGPYVSLKAVAKHLPAVMGFSVGDIQRGKHVPIDASRQGPVGWVSTRF